MFPAQAPLPSSPTNTDVQGSHRPDTIRYIRGPWYGGLNTVHRVPRQWAGLVTGQVTECSVRPAARVVHAFGTTSQIKTAHLPIASCQAAWPPSSLSEARPGPPNCPPNLVPWPITGGAKSYRCACHWTAAAGHHAIPAAVWTVSLVKSNHLSGKQPGKAPPRETNVPLWQLRRHRRRRGKLQISLFPWQVADR